MNPLETELARGWHIHQQKKYAEAERIYRTVLKQAANNPNAWCYLGIVLHDQRRYVEAVQAYQHALQLQADFPIALNNLGNSLRYTHHYEEADRCFAQAIKLKPDYLNAYKNRGTLHVWTGDLDRGQGYYEQALQIQPGDAEVHRNLGVIYLLQGRFEDGWREYRWRWRVGDLHRPNLQASIWDGSDLNGRSIVLSAEQGLGDTLHFVRFAEVLRQRGARTITYCQPALLALLQNNPRLGPVYPNNLPLDRPVDWQCSLLDAADLLGTNANNIPAACVPYIQASPRLRSYWQARLPKSADVFRVGIAWQGNPDHQADTFRSLPLKHFEVFSDVAGVELVSLQSGFGSEQTAGWRGHKPLRLLGSEVDQSSGAFMDTAALLHQLDLVITSDTAIAHLAAAMGRPTWIALGYVPDWRWLLERSDSPWYPTVRLFRQPKMGDWASVFVNLRAALAEHIAN